MCVVLFFSFDQGYFCLTKFLLLDKIFNEAMRGAPPRPQGGMLKEIHFVRALSI